jgi:hypothetical protein
MKQCYSKDFDNDSQTIIKTLQLLDGGSGEGSGSSDRRPKYMLVCVEKWSWWRMRMMVGFWVVLILVGSLVYGLFAGFDKAASFAGNLATIGGLGVTLVAAVGTFS